MRTFRYLNAEACLKKVAQEVQRSDFNPMVWQEDNEAEHRRRSVLVVRCVSGVLYSYQARLCFSLSVGA